VNPPQHNFWICGTIDSVIFGRALSISRAGFGREFDERIALPNGRDAPIDLGSAANAF